MPENEIIFEEGMPDTPVEIISSQMEVINTLIDTEYSPYDTFQEDRIKAISMAFKVITATQKKILKDL